MQDKLETSLSILIKWFDTMRAAPGAYAGPIVHWWQCSFLYCGPGVNWTYEGLLESFAELYKKTKYEYFIQRAVEAGSFILKSRLPSGLYENSFFELNPLTDTSSVHEAGVALGLISIGTTLDSIGLKGKPWINAARNHAEEILYQLLWDPTVKTFRSGYGNIVRGGYILNIMATISQVFLKLYHFLRKQSYKEAVLHVLQFILKYQRRSGNDLLDGSFPQGLHDLNAYSLYNARVVNFLLDVYEYLEEDRALEAAEGCGNFLLRLEDEDGGFALLADRKGRIYRRPKLIGGCSEVIRALIRLKSYSSDFKNFDEWKHINWLLKFQDSIGGFRTFKGLHSDESKVDYKEVFHVCGWNDKILRLLSLIYEGSSIQLQQEIQETHIECWLGNKKSFFIENEKEVMIKDLTENIIYRWTKGENLADVNSKYLNFFTRPTPYSYFI